MKKLTPKMLPMKLNSIAYVAYWVEGGVYRSSERFDTLAEAKRHAQMIGAPEVKQIRGLGGRNAAIVRSYPIPSKGIMR